LVSADLGVGGFRVHFLVSVADGCRGSWIVFIVIDVVIIIIIVAVIDIIVVVVVVTVSRATDHFVHEFPGLFDLAPVDIEEGLAVFLGCRSTTTIGVVGGSRPRKGRLCWVRCFRFRFGMVVS